jgi:hypothetical protein
VDVYEEMSCDDVNCRITDAAIISLCEIIINDEQMANSQRGSKEKDYLSGESAKDKLCLFQLER